MTEPSLEVSTCAYALDAVVSIAPEDGGAKENIALAVEHKTKSDAAKINFTNGNIEKPEPVFQLDTVGGETQPVSTQTFDNDSDEYYYNSDESDTSRDGGQSTDGRSNRTIICNNCSQPGHIARECRTQICYICGSLDDHSTYRCPQRVQCNNCFRFGHIARNCSYRYGTFDPYSPRYPCTRCHAFGHPANICPTIWRLYVSARDAPKNATVRRFCYFCGESGHWGDDCLRQRQYVVSAFGDANTPLVAKESLAQSGNSQSQPFDQPPLPSILPPMQPPPPRENIRSGRDMQNLRRSRTVDDIQAWRKAPTAPLASVRNSLSFRNGSSGGKSLIQNTGNRGRDRKINNRASDIGKERTLNEISDPVQKSSTLDVEVRKSVKRTRQGRSIETGILPSRSANTGETASTRGDDPANQKSEGSIKKADLAEDHIVSIKDVTFEKQSDKNCRDIDDSTVLQDVAEVQQESDRAIVNSSDNHTKARDRNGKDAKVPYDGAGQKDSEKKTSFISKIKRKALKRKEKRRIMKEAKKANGLNSSLNSADQKSHGNLNVKPVAMKPSKKRKADSDLKADEYISRQDAQEGANQNVGRYSNKMKKKAQAVFKKFKRNR